MHTLFIGDRSYSSWSLRAWLLFERWGLDVSLRHVDFMQGTVRDHLAEVAPAQTVPAVLLDGEVAMWDSLAIGEELASRHPDLPFWPKDPARRALARSLAAEMHASFSALRTDCPMNLRAAYQDVPHSDEVLADVARIDQLWTHARALAADGPWLCGAYSIADAMYAPVAARIAGYDLPVSQAAADYVAAHLADPAFRRWRAMGLAKGATLPWYDRDYARRDWPGPVPAKARKVEHGPSQNTACPYSGKTVTHFLELDGVVWGFCNAFCRDKTVADPTAWPAFAAMVAKG